ncbi:hypothetical protein [Pseudoalteromonas luteoviolacea]|uniref:Uncharacterized protein n=1 Tax=Pseudoalteromonas luteoviolacea DSM 6061 TaxID=1365250 RepID=A0A166VWW9_9GAMM|nr:hypothetical protein [Pseudoalteromonas luteoviolacea]KZN34100.1 hypothetical protein N475_19285 [Pseudoalteromonas luteoviolacea DSM 6061]MBE0389696.1 hypothetical protein [Pseudoalteromonas luteoviolacea DSM 6061]
MSESLRKSTITIVNDTGFTMKYIRAHAAHGVFDGKPSPNGNNKAHYFFPDEIEQGGHVEFTVKNKFGVAPIGPQGYITYYILDGQQPTTIVTVDYNHPFGPTHSSYDVSFSNEEDNNKVFIGSEIKEPQEPVGHEQTVKITLVGQEVVKKETA